MAESSPRVEQAWRHAREVYSELGVDAEDALERLARVPVSLNCWQGDDVRGFEDGGAALDGGLAVSGNYLGRARDPDELRRDAEQALRCIPGRHRFNLHASYAETGGARVDRDALQPGHFAGWIGWARERGLGLDFNPTFFAHPKAADGFTLAHADPAVRGFWIEHGRACRRVGAAFGAALGTPCVTNVWVPDGYKDTPADRAAPRARLAEALDQVFAEELDPALQLDAVEPKLFGIGSESYVAGSHEFYLGYAISRRKLLCLDMGHQHPTEVLSDKLSAALPYLPGVLLHVSRGVRWDSDHVVTLSDELEELAKELVRLDALGLEGAPPRVHLGLDFFDASINRVAAWVIGTRSLQKALLLALLEPADTLQALERDGDFTGRLALLEELKSLPAGAVWDYHCLRQGAPVGLAWLDEVRRYERDVLSQR
ncbi:MAG: L-rhamnose isomerase [Planctomycetes bacterium]|nr:L-rhamnose isomerase [Planctomycetota bacterium]MBL7009065.1 L-rhamnose isomerase [Planctomycetota bacterium]